jgi:DNA-binding NtrC family response regulator
MKSPRPFRIVAVDYEQVILEILGRLFQAEFDQVTVMSFSHSSDAWKELLRADPDLLITEFTMPGLHGKEMLQRLLDRKAAYRIVVMSGLDEFEQTVQEFARRGLNVRFLPKPFTIESFREALNISNGIPSFSPVLTRSRYAGSASKTFHRP